MNGTTTDRDGIRPGRYRHFKGGEYEVLGVARHSEGLEDMVVYRPLYGQGRLWVRPLSMFTEDVLHEGKTCPRFALVEDPLSP
ncbi:MAG: DUF1653 domain-containing protein [Desulfovibrionales bacterium]|nr:DUF1653 domain-containing protein [Desulfovibrionales bacterium]